MRTLKLVLLCHGRSLWNLKNRYTGWTDVDRITVDQLISIYRLAISQLKFRCSNSGEERHE